MAKKTTKAAKTERDAEFYDVIYDASGAPTTRGAGDQPGDPPPEWIDAVFEHLGSIHTINLRWRRGSSGYRDLRLPGVPLVLPDLVERADELDADPKDKTWRAAEAREIVEQLWRICLRYTRAEGPVVDFQLWLYKFDGKTGDLRPACDPISKRLNLTGEVSSRIVDDTGDRKVDVLLAVIKEQRKEKDDAHKQYMELQDGMTKVLGSVQQLSMAVFGAAGEALRIREQASDAATRNAVAQSNARIREERVRRGLSIAEKFVDQMPWEDVGLFLRTFRSASERTDDHDGEDASPIHDIGDACRRFHQDITPEQEEILGEAIFDIDRLCRAAAETVDPGALDNIGRTLLAKLAPFRDLLRGTGTAEQLRALEYLWSRLQ